MTDYSKFDWECKGHPSLNSNCGTCQKCLRNGWAPSSPDVLIPPRSAVSYLVDKMNKVTDEERLAIFSHYCTHCGTLHLPCYCMRDE